MRSIRITLAAVAVTVALCPAGSVWAQGRRGGPGRMERAPGAMRRGGNGPRLNGPGAAIQQFEHMSPEQREKAISRLPPERQAKVRQQLQRYDSLPEPQKQRLQRLWRLPPEKQQQVRQSMRDFTELPQPRKRAIRQQLRQMQGMTPGERKAYFKSPEFRDNFSPDERDMMRNMSLVLPPE